MAIFLHINYYPTSEHQFKQVLCISYAQRYLSCADRQELVFPCLTRTPHPILPQDSRLDIEKEVQKLL